MVVAVAGALALQQFEEAAAVVVLFGIAGFLEDRCSLAARDAIAAVLALKPDFAILSPSGEPSAPSSHSMCTRAGCSSMAVQKGLNRVERSHT